MLALNCGLTSFRHILVIEKNLIRSEPYSVILYNRVIFPLVALHAPEYLVFKFAKVLFHPIIEGADLLFNVECGEVV